MTKEELMALGLSEELAQKVIDKYTNMIPKHRFDEVNNTVKTLQEQIQQSETKLEELKKSAGSAEELKQKIEELQRQNTEEKAELQKKLEKQSFDFALERALSAAEAKNPRAVKALLDTEKIKLDGETLLGLDDQLKALKESDAYLFGEDDPLLKGREPNKSKGKASSNVNPWKKDQVNLTEQGRILKTDPDLAKQLMEEAGIK